MTQAGFIHELAAVIHDVVLDPLLVQLVTVQVTGTGMPGADPSTFPVMLPTFGAILDTYGSAADLWVRTSSSNNVPRHFQTNTFKCGAGGLVSGSS